LRIMKKPGRNLLVFWFSLILILFLNRLSAQETRKDTILIHANGSVTFQYRDSAAQCVKLICDAKLKRPTLTIKTEDYHSVNMKRDSDGIWRFTSPTLAPEVYTYQFECNGRHIPDPTNPDSIRVRDEKMSVFTIGGTPQANLYINEHPSGKVDTVEFICPDQSKPRRIIVYTPPQYAEGQDEFPVLYLLHGLNGNETSWSDRGRAVQILDNLIAMGKAKPMILVMPDANPVCLISQKEDIGLFKNIMLYSSWDLLEFEKCFPSMDEFLSGLYRFSHRTGDRAVAGLSAGAKQSCNLANMYSCTFSSVGLFSPVVGRKQLPSDNYSKYWVGGGTSDFFRGRINMYRKHLQRKHIVYTMYSTVGGHTWRNWRVYFTEYVQTLFWNKK